MVVRLGGVIKDLRDPPRTTRGNIKDAWSELGPSGRRKRTLASTFYDLCTHDRFLVFLCYHVVTFYQAT